MWTRSRRASCPGAQDRPAWQLPPAACGARACSGCSASAGCGPRCRPASPRLACRSIACSVFPWGLRRLELAVDFVPAEDDLLSFDDGFDDGFGGGRDDDSEDELYDLRGLDDHHRQRRQRRAAAQQGTQGLLGALRALTHLEVRAGCRCGVPLGGAAGPCCPLRTSWGSSDRTAAPHASSPFIAPAGAAPHPLLQRVRHRAGAAGRLPAVAHQPATRRVRQHVCAGRRGELLPAAAGPLPWAGRVCSQRRPGEHLLPAVRAHAPLVPQVRSGCRLLRRHRCGLLLQRCQLPPTWPIHDASVLLSSRPPSRPHPAPGPAAQL